jgi:Flp pilus assembly protein TadD
MAIKSPGEDVRQLRTSVDWAMRRALEPEQILPLLRRLAGAAHPDSEDFAFAHRHLAELSVETQPWVAALSAKKLAVLYPDDHRAWAILGLAFSLLAHFHCAVAAYRRAVALAPNNPWYAHNLGHLLDVALNRPQDGLSLLASAHRREPDESEIASSYAHALGRTGNVEKARDLMKRTVKRGATADQKALLQWLEEGAPPKAAARRRRARPKTSGGGTPRPPT